MSRSTFHEHFRTVTAMSPIEFRIQLRMQEARRLMVSNAMDAPSAGFHVGYDSPSQFSRDYSRIFGSPPAKHAKLLRASTKNSGARESRSSLESHADLGCGVIVGDSGSISIFQDS